MPAIVVMGRCQSPCSSEEHSCSTRHNSPSLEGTSQTVGVPLYPSTQYYTHLVLVQVVITGSSKGLGYALAHHFLALGDEVVVNSRSAEACKRAVNSLAALHPERRVLAFPGDVRQAGALHEPPGKFCMGSPGASSLPLTLLTLSTQQNSNCPTEMKPLCHKQPKTGQ